MRFVNNNWPLSLTVVRATGRVLQAATVVTSFTLAPACSRHTFPITTISSRSSTPTAYPAWRRKCSSGSPLPQTSIVMRTDYRASACILSLAVSYVLTRHAYVCVYPAMENGEVVVEYDRQSYS